MNELLEPAELLPMYLFGEDQWKKSQMNIVDLFVLSIIQGTY